MAANTAVGTTPEVLQHYLTAGIEVEMLWFPQDGDRRKLCGLNGHKVLLDGNQATSASNCLPVLRPFSALCEPLEDGTVPAVEFARLCLGDEVDLENEVAFYEAADEDEDEDGDTHGSEETVEVSGTDSHTGSRSRFTIYPDWTWYGYGESDNCAPAAAINYLRSKHFAVGLEPGQYIEKVSSAAPIDKNTAL